MESSNIIQLNPENFQQVILEQSKTRLILVAFYADQVPESLELKTKLEGIASQHSQHLVLATVDCQAQQAIAMQFGIQNIPTAVLIKDGQPLDGIAGPQPDEAIKQFLEKHLPKPEDDLLSQARELLAASKANEAFPLIQQAHQLDSERADIKLVMADVDLQLGKMAEAEAVLATIKMVDQDSYYQSLMAKLELAAQAAESPEIKALEQQLSADSDNIELVHKLAAQYSQVNRQEDALALLLSVLQKDAGDADSKRIMLDILKALPDGDPLAARYRRKLFALMY